MAQRNFYRPSQLLRNADIREESAEYHALRGVKRGNLPKGRIIPFEEATARLLLRGAMAETQQ